MYTKNKPLIVLAIFVAILILGSTLYYSIKKINNSSFGKGDYSLISEVKLKEFDQKKSSEMFNQNNFKELNEILDLQLAKNPKEINILYQKAQALAQEASLTFKEKELGDQAMVYIDKVLLLEPKNVQALTLKGYIYEIQQDYVNAHKYYDEALKIDPKNVDTLAQKGHAYDLEGNKKEAEKLYQKALNFSGDDEKLLGNYARLISDTDKKKAIEIYKRLLSSKNNRVLAEANYSLGMLSEQEAYDPIVENYYLNSVRIDPIFALGYVGLAREQFKKSFLEKQLDSKKALIENSLSNLKKSLEINPNQTYAKIQLAIELASLKNKELSLKILNSANENLKKDITLSEQDKVKVKIIIESLIKTQN